MARSRSVAEVPQEHGSVVATETVESNSSQALNATGHGFEGVIIISISTGWVVVLMVSLCFKMIFFVN